MIITITGKPCCGKSTMAEIFTKKYGFERIYAGAIFKEEAKKMGLNVMELCSSDKAIEIDCRVDEYLKNIYDTRFDENLLIESRTSWSFMPKAFNVFIDVEDDIMAKRLLNSDRTGKEKVENIEEAKNNVKTRFEADCKRYKKIYNIDCKNMNNYDLVIDNSYLTPEETADKIYEEYLRYTKKNTIE